MLCFLSKFDAAAQMLILGSSVNTIVWIVVSSTRRGVFVLHMFSYINLVFCVLICFLTLSFSSSLVVKIQGEKVFSIF